MLMNKSSDTLGNWPRDLPVCGAVPQPLHHRVPRWELEEQKLQDQGHIPSNVSLWVTEQLCECCEYIVLWGVRCNGGGTTIMGSKVQWWWDNNNGETEVLRDTFIWVPLCPPQVPYWLACNWTQAYSNRLPTDWLTHDMAWPSACNLISQSDTRVVMTAPDWGTERMACRRKSTVRFGRMR
jgi:hypothetical protein